MKKIKKRLSIYNIIIRYLILILAGIPNLWIFYFIFTPLTIYPVYFLTSLFFDVSLLSKDILLINREIPIELIKACIAGAAYYLLLILNLSVPKIKFNERIKMIFFAFSFFLIINILRIFLLILIFMKGYSFFDEVHLLFWYLLSIAFVIAIWFIEVKIFKIKEIPVYSDLKFIFKFKKKLRKNIDKS